MRPDAGASHLVLGAGLGTERAIDLADAHATFAGERRYDYSGFAVSGAGDVNGDGRDDLLIGARGNNSGGARTGESYLLLGDL